MDELYEQKRQELSDITEEMHDLNSDRKICEERIRQIEAKALRKLRHPSRSRKLKDYLE